MVNVCSILRLVYLKVVKYVLILERLVVVTVTQSWWCPVRNATASAFVDAELHSLVPTERLLFLFALLARPSSRVLINQRLVYFG